MNFDQLRDQWRAQDQEPEKVWPIDPDKAMTTLRGMKFESPRGPVAIDPDTRGIVQNVYIRRVARVGGKLRYVEIATIPLVRDPIEH